ncbi:MAG TPA: hypothetical protein VL463_02245 [Kofleriaceae bacterium]|nr:hypothetical protein [Kofleriaceae bacterium]
MRFAWLLFLAGCFTARVSAGPHASSAGRGGMSAAAGYGFGYGWDGKQAVYLSGGVGVTSDQVAQLTITDSIDYVNHMAGWPMRFSGRFGVVMSRDKYGEPERPYFGAGVAFFPWHDRAGGGDDEEHDEKFGDVFPKMAAHRGLGVELDVDAMPAVSATDTTRAERTAMIVTCALVGELDGMLDD